MNKFATIKEFGRYDKVTFYSVQFTEDGISETDKFFDFCRNNPKFHKSARMLVRWIEDIGNEYGANDSGLFRDEGLAIALPPDPEQIANGPYRKLFLNQNLRLYGYWVSTSVIILFNGGLKTAWKVKDCPNVRKHFNNAQKIIEELDKIGIRHTFCNIDNISDLFFEIEVEE